MHIGSQLTSVSPFVEATEKVVALVEELKSLKYDIEFFSIGGGIGIVYEDSLASGDLGVVGREKSAGPEAADNRGIRRAAWCRC